MKGSPIVRHLCRRLVCGGVLAASSATLAIAAHALAGGAMPDTGLTVVLTLLIAGTGTAVAERGINRLALIAVLGIAQVAEHALLSLAHSHDAPSGSLMTGTHLLAVLLTASLLVGANDGALAAFAALSMLLPRWTLGTPAATRPPSVRRTPPVVPENTEQTVLLRRITGRRGPPVLS